MEKLIFLSLALQLLVGDKVILSRTESTEVERSENVAIAIYALLSHLLAMIFAAIFSNMLKVPETKPGRIRAVKCIVTVKISFDSVAALGTASDTIYNRDAETAIYALTGFAITRAIRDATAMHRSLSNTEVSNEHSS